MFTGKLAVRAQPATARAVRTRPVTTPLEIVHTLNDRLGQRHFNTCIFRCCNKRAVNFIDLGLHTELDMLQHRGAHFRILAAEHKEYQMLDKSWQLRKPVNRDRPRHSTLFNVQRAHDAGGSTQGAAATSGGGPAQAATPPTAKWAKSVVASASKSVFLASERDTADNILAVGYQQDDTAVRYGIGVSVTASANFNALNAVLVKYSSAGIAQWARAVTAAASSSEYFSVTTDTFGNIFATGYQYGQSAFTYGPGVFVTDPHSTNNISIVKYDTSGTAIWARTLTSGTGYSVLTGISVDSSGHLFCTGQQYDTGTFNWGNGITTKEKSSQNPLLIKFDAMWTPKFQILSSIQIDQVQE